MPHSKFLVENITIPKYQMIFDNVPTNTEHHITKANWLDGGKQRKPVGCRDSALKQAPTNFST